MFLKSKTFSRIYVKYKSLKIYQKIIKKASQDKVKRNYILNYEEI